MFVSESRPGDTPGDNWWRSSGLIAETRSYTEPILTYAHAVVRDAGAAKPTLENGTWHRRFAFTSGSTAGTADLSATVSGDEVFWTARVTMPSHGMVNYLLFTGVSDTAATSGSWSIKTVRADTVELALVEWEVSSDTVQAVRLIDRGILRFNETATIHYDVNGSSRALRYEHEITGYPPFRLEAMWDIVTRTGRLHVFGPPEEERCWGERLEDILCGADD